MNNFIINSSTIAVLKSNKKTIIIDVDKIRVININIKKVLNYNCLFNGSSYNDRIKYSKKIINKSYKIPIYINKDIILMPLNNIRNNNSLFIIFNKIVKYFIKNNKLCIECNNNYYFIGNISKYSFEKLLIDIIKINNYINNKNIDNFV